MGSSSVQQANCQGFLKAPQSLGCLVTTLSCGIRHGYADAQSTPFVKKGQILSGTLPSSKRSIVRASRPRGIPSPPWDSLAPVETWMLDARETSSRFKMCPSAVWHMNTDNPGSATRAIVLKAASSSRSILVVHRPARAYKDRPA